MSQENLEQRLREIPLQERLVLCRAMIGKMCSERRPPKMTIPVQWDDEDFFISTTLKDAMDRVVELKKSDDIFKKVIAKLTEDNHGIIPNWLLEIGSQNKQWPTPPGPSSPPHTGHIHKQWG